MIGDFHYEVLLALYIPPYITVTINNHHQVFAVVRNDHHVFVHHNNTDSIMLKEIPRFPDKQTEIIKGGYKAPMPGEVIKVLVKPGDAVKAGDPLLVIISMKMENTIEAHEDGIVEEVYVAEKGFVEADTLLVKINAS
jgi:biotin carboxyl carrier protein